MTDKDVYREIQMEIQGMTGTGGEPKVIQALEGLEGVKKATASHPEKKAVVLYNTASVTLEHMRNALLKAGYVAFFANNEKCENLKPLSGLKNEFQSDDLVCYCFKFTKNDIEQDYMKNGQSTIIAKISSEKKAGGCNCANKNPKGRGCLVDVRQVVDKLKGRSSFKMIGGKRFAVRNGIMDIKQSNTIITLDSSLDPLKDQFNDNKEKIRFLSLLSPTCPLGRDKGARAVHETISGKFSNADISASIVWIPILDNDNIEEALPSVKFLSDKRFKHLYDQHQTVGKAIASSVGWIGKIAWDIYLFYAPYSEWTDKPPSPSHWMHQLTDNWATKEKYRTGADLKNELLVSIEKLLSI